MVRRRPTGDVVVLAVAYPVWEFKPGEAGGFFVGLTEGVCLRELVAGDVKLREVDCRGVTLGEVE
jgi:hypothetical protein